MKNFRCLRLFSLLAAVCILLTGCGDKVPTSKELKATEKLFVNDFADVISSEDEEAIYKKGAYLDDKTTAQIAVVTVPTTGDEEISDYALNLGRNWGLGDKEKNNGIVILLSVEDREVYIAVGYGLEGALPDSKTGRIIDEYGIPYFSDDKFSKGLLSLYNAIYNETLIEYGISPDEGYVPIDKLSSQDTTTGDIAVFWVILILFVVMFILLSKKRGVFFFIGGPPRGGFGGFGGHSSGGFGGGGFRGGGGSFGGGGAGRGF